MSYKLFPEDSLGYNLLRRSEAEKGIGVTHEGNPIIESIKDAYDSARLSIDESIVLLNDDDFLEKLIEMEDRLHRIELTLLPDHIGITKDKELKLFEKRQRELVSLRNFTPEEKIIVLEELKYIQENLPSLDEFSNIALLATAVAMGSVNATVAWAGKHAITAYLGYLAANETDPLTKSILSFTTVYSIITNFVPVLPSLSGGLRYLFYFVPGQTSAKMFRLMFSKNESLKLQKKEFLSLSKLSLISGLGVFTIIPLEVLRIFNLKDVSLNTIKIWGAVHAQRNFKKDIL